MRDKRRTRHGVQQLLVDGADAARAIVNAENALDSGDDALAQREVEALLKGNDSFPEAHFMLGEIARRRSQGDVAQRHYRRAIQLDAHVAHFHHALGNALQDSGKLDEAIDSYRRALRLASRLPAIWNDLGTAYFAAGHPEQAAQSYRSALRYSPEHTVALSNLGAALRALGDVKGAAAAYRQELWQRLRGIVRRTGRNRRLADAAEQWLARGSTRVALAIADAALEDEPGNEKALAVKTTVALRNDDVVSAIDLLKDALRHAPESALLFTQLGRALRSRGDNSEASGAFTQALAKGERSVGIQLELAYTLAAAGKLDESIALVDRLARRAASAEAWTALAGFRLDAGDLPGGEVAIGKALSLDATAPQALAQLARVRIAQNQPSEALQLCETALECEPRSFEAHFWRGRTLAVLGQWRESVDAFAEATSLDQMNVSAARWLGIALRGAERVEESQVVLREALKRNPGNFDLRAELVESMFEAGDVVRAREMLEQLLVENPDHVGALAAVSWLLNVEGRLTEAEDCGRRAITLDSAHVIAHHNLGLTLLKAGKFEEGWPHYEWRRRIPEQVPAYRRFPYPEWDGMTTVERALFVYAEQGLGDEIMFSSCLPDVVRRVPHVAIECDPRLGALFARSFPGVAVFPRVRTQINTWVRSIDPQPDFQIPLASLPAHYRQRPDAFPNHQGYLTPDPAKLERWRSWLKALGPGLKIGLSWRGGLVKTGRTRRSLDLNELESILKIEGVRFVSLQYGAVNEELARLERLRGIRIPHIQEAIDDYDESAALICALDLVVSVCTSVVHLAGALGRQVIVMAPYSPEWRYGFSGDSMPWYPSVKILRQRQAGEWAPVLNDVREALRERLNTA